MSEAQQVADFTPHGERGKGYRLGQIHRFLMELSV